MTRSWVSGGKSSDSIERLRREIDELENQRDQLIEANKHRIFEWASLLLNSLRRDPAGSSVGDDHRDQAVAEILAKFEFLNQSIMDKQVLLNEKVDEQAKLDSLG